MSPRLTLSAFIVAVAILPAACAPQPAGMAAPAPASTLSGPANTAPAASPMPSMAGMDHSNMPSMQGMDMNAMMAHCAQMRQQPGARQTAQGRQMLDQCDQMDRSMGMTPPPRR